MRNIINKQNILKNTSHWRSIHDEKFSLLNDSGNLIFSIVSYEYLRPKNDIL